MDESKDPKLLCCTGVDRISQLPDNIIDIILIRLPIADAARSAVLSRKWKDGWINISQLEFDSSFASKFNKFGQQNIMMAIYTILMLHSGPIIGFKLLITCPKRISEIDCVFHFLSSKGVQKLDVCILQSDFDVSADYILPSCFYSCLQLKYLKIAHCTINPPPRNFGGFRNLNHLELEYLELINSMFENFISKCPLLEELIIKSCNFIESSVIKINASNLTRFDFNGVGSCFRFIYVPLLKSLKYIDSRYYEAYGRGPSYEGVEMLSLEELCNALPALESLEVDFYFLQTLEVYSISEYGRCPKWSHRLKSLQAYYLRLCNMDEVASLLGLIGSSPNLNVLDIEMDLPYYTAEKDNPFISLEPNHLGISCEKLQVVTLSKIGGHDSEMDFVKLLLLKSPQLNTMFIQVIERVTPNIQLKIQTKVNRFRRASATVEVDFGGYE